MDLPCVKIVSLLEKLSEFNIIYSKFRAQGRARQLYSNGFRTLEDVAKSSIGNLVEKIEHLNYRVARQLISAAKVSILFVLLLYKFIYLVQSHPSSFIIYRQIFV